MPVPLSLELFLRAGQDWEAAQYRILAALQSHRLALRQHRLFPTRLEVSRLREQLLQLLRSREELEDVFPHILVRIDWAALRLERIPEYTPAARERFLQQVFELLQWALPLVEQLWQESQALYEFACEHIGIHELGILPLYRDEGYLLTPDPTQHQLLVWHYRLSPVYTAEQQREVTLELVWQEPFSGILHPEQLLQRVRTLQLPHPATYVCDTDFALPLRETVLPIARQKLWQRLQERPH
jgi:hypothetical protein